MLIENDRELALDEVATTETLKEKAVEKVSSAEADVRMSHDQYLLHAQRRPGAN